MTMFDPSEELEVTVRLKLAPVTLLRLDILAKDWGLSRSATVEKLLEDLMAGDDVEYQS